MADAGKPLFDQGQRVGDRTHVVRSQGQFHAAFARMPRYGFHEHRRHPLETGVGGRLVRPDRHGPAHLLGMDHFVIPVGALDQSHAHLPAAAAGPIDQPPGVVHAAAQIGLHRQAGGKIDGLATALEERDRQVLHGGLFHVEIDQHPALGGRAEDRLQGRRQGP